MSTATVSFDVPQYKKLAIIAIAHRAADLTGRDALEIEMDLRATYANGCKFDVDKLARADKFNFLHDINGIDRHLNRETGKLEDLFMPRCARC